MEYLSYPGLLINKNKKELINKFQPNKDMDTTNNWTE